MPLRHSAVLLFVFLASSCWLPFQGAKQSSPAEFVSQIKRVKCDNRDRLESVRSLFSEFGADPGDLEIEDFEYVKNLAVTVPGETDETIVVGAHYDKTTLGCGAIDNWTGIVILANLYKSLKDQRNKKTFRFVAFGDEEKGLVGSREMVRAIPKGRLAKHCAMVNFDSFGFEDLWALQRASDASLINLAKNLAIRNGTALPVKNYSGAVSDSRSFQIKGIPAITLSGLDDNWRSYLHQEKDQLSNINIEKVFENYVFALEYLEEIDSSRCDEFR
ncbi:MAG: M20/M25/M40 family metallo-hydrolase [Pyrinomonadaceae bacterium]|nr:M20/M25/M40 family metallo-hydrolase [Pyrinomonadaceae bacterium]